MPTKKDQPKPAEGKPRAALETSSGGITVIGETAPAPKPNNEDPTDAD